MDLGSTDQSSILTDTPQGMSGPDGSELITLMAYPPYFNLQDGDPVNTMAIDFASFGVIGQDWFEQAIQSVIPNIMAAGETILCYGVYRSTIFDVNIPNQICIFGACFTPPFAGDNVTSMYSYHLVVYTISTPPAVALAVRPLGPAVIVVIVLGIITIITLIVAVYEISTGNLTWKDLQAYTHDIITAPGQNISQAMTGPFIGLGLVLVASSIALPALVSHLDVSAPIGPARISAGGTSGGGGAPGGARRR